MALDGEDFQAGKLTTLPSTSLPRSLHFSVGLEARISQNGTLRLDDPIFFNLDILESSLYRATPRKSREQRS